MNFSSLYANENLDPKCERNSFCMLHTFMKRGHYGRKQIITIDPKRRAQHSKMMIRIRVHPVCCYQMLTGILVHESVIRAHGVDKAERTPNGRYTAGERASVLMTFPYARLG